MLTLFILSCPTRYPLEENVRENEAEDKRCLAQERIQQTWTLNPIKYEIIDDRQISYQVLNQWNVSLNTFSKGHNNNIELWRFTDSKHGFHQLSHI
jgi:hypothetical protein